MKTILTRTLINTISKAVGGGANYRTAATAAGVSRRTLFNWRRKGAAESEGLYRELLDQMQRAEAQFITGELSIIQRAGRVSWQASAWLLERRFPDLFGRTDRFQAHQMKELRDELTAIRTELNKPTLKLANPFD